MLAKLLLATVLGGAIGLEREMAGKPAGLRTNILICVGAALFTQLSVDVAQVGYTADGRPFGDTGRIAAQIVSGIGLLGAGAILHGEGTVVGLRPFEQRLAAKRRRVRATLRVKPGISFDDFETLILANGVHVFSRRTFEHDTDRTFELELIGATKQFDIVCDRLRAHKDVVSITTE